MCSGAPDDETFIYHDHLVYKGFNPDKSCRWWDATQSDKWGDFTEVCYKSGVHCATSQTPNTCPIVQEILADIEADAKRYLDMVQECQSILDTLETTYHLKTVTSR
jgi:hypothetical protein